MRYIIIPLLIILYGWWTIASIKEVINNYNYPRDYAAIYVVSHIFIAAIVALFYSIQFCWEHW